jgi:hypothetical protein
MPAMTFSRPPLRQTVRVRRPAPRVPALYRPAAVRRDTAGSRTPKGWHRERRRGMIAAVIVALMGGLLSAYGVHLQMSQAAARALARDLHLAAATAKALGSGAVLFVPEYGNVCRRRWIDNTTWTLRDGGEIACDAAVSWNATIPAPQYQITQRLGAIRNVFQSKVTGNLD